MNIIRLVFACVLLIDLASPSQAVRATNATPTMPTPSVLFVVFEQDLKQPIASSTALARRFVENGYECEFVVAESASKQLKVEFDSNTSVRINTVATLDDTESAIKVWRERCFNLPNAKTPNDRAFSPFGFVIFIGHGESRREGAFSKDYLIQTQGNAKQAVCIQSVAEEFGRRALPVVFIVDMCRNETPETIPESNTKRSSYKYSQEEFENPSRHDAIIAKNRFASFARNDQATVSPVLTLWSTQPGKGAYDSGDFIGALVAGFERMGSEFIARHLRASNLESTPNSLLPLERKTDLSVFTLFSYAASHMIESKHLQPSLSLGLVDPSMLCASTDPTYVHAPPPVDLLSQWNQFADSDILIRKVPNGLEFERPAGATVSKLTAVSFFGGGAIPWHGRSLAVEASLSSSTTNNGTRRVGCLLIPGDNASGIILAPKWREAIYEVQPQTNTTTIPLIGDDGWQFTSLALSVPPAEDAVWPEGESVTISRITVLARSEGNRSEPMPMPRMDEIDLVPRWWPNEFQSESDDLKVNTLLLPAKPKTSRVFSMRLQNNPEGIKAGRGGSVFRPPYISREHSKLRINVLLIKPLFNSKMKPQADVVIQSENGNILVQPLRKGQQEYAFLSDGFACHISILTTDLEELQISDFAVITK